MLGIGAATAVIGKASTMVDCPIQSAFDYVGYGLFQHYRVWCPQVVELDVISEGPLGVGTMARQVTLDRGIKTESTFRIAEFNPPTILELEGISDPFCSIYALEELGAASIILIFSFEIRELELFMRPFKKLVRAALQEGAQQTVENLKQLLEEQMAS